MNENEVELFNKTYAQLEAIHSEIALLSKKSPTDAVNEFKLRLINRLLETANRLLGQEGKPFQDFEAFKEEDLPSNSDVTMIASQYLMCLEETRSLNIELSGGWWYWVIDGNKSQTRTLPPRRLKE